MPVSPRGRSNYSEQSSIIPSCVLVSSRQLTKSTVRGRLGAEQTQHVQVHHLHATRYFLLRLARSSTRNTSTSNRQSTCPSIPQSQPHTQQPATFVLSRLRPSPSRDVQLLHVPSPGRIFLARLRSVFLTVMASPPPVAFLLHQHQIEQYFLSTEFSPSSVPWRCASELGESLRSPSPWSKHPIEFRQSGWRFLWNEHAEQKTGGRRRRRHP